VLLLPGRKGRCIENPLIGLDRRLPNLRKTGEKPGGEKAFSEVKDDLKEALARNAKNAAFGRFMGELRADAKIEFRDE
jgi:hypothetical protein